MILDPNKGFVSKVQQLVSWGHWFVFFNIFICAAISTLYVSAQPLPITFSGLLYLITNWIGHTAFLTFVIFLVSIFPITLVFPYVRHIRGVSALLATIGFVILTLDAFTYQKLGYHITYDSFSQAVELISHNIEVHPLRATIGGTLLVVSLLVIQLVISNFVWKHIHQLRASTLGKSFTMFYLLCFFSSHLIHIFADANNQYEITKQDNMLPLSYPATAKGLLAKNGLIQSTKQSIISQDNGFSDLTLNPKSTLISQCALQNKLEFANPLELNVYIADSSEIKNNVDTVLKSHDFQQFEKYVGPTNINDHLFNLEYGLPANFISNKQQAVGIKQLNSESLSYEKTKLNNADDIKFISSEHDQFVLVLYPQEGKRDVISSHSFFIKTDTSYRIRNKLTQPFDIHRTIVERWGSCNGNADSLTTAFTPIGIDLFKRNKNTITANYSANTLIVTQKDIITLVGPTGSIQSYSSSQLTKLNDDLKFPSLVDGINQIKKFSINKQ